MCLSTGEFGSIKWAVCYNNPCCTFDFLQSGLTNVFCGAHYALPYCRTCFFLCCPIRCLASSVCVLFDGMWGDVLNTLICWCGTTFAQYRYAEDSGEPDSKSATDPHRNGDRSCCWIRAEPHQSWSKANPTHRGPVPYAMWNQSYDITNPRRCLHALCCLSIDSPVGPGRFVDMCPECSPFPPLYSPFENESGGIGTTADHPSSLLLAGASNSYSHEATSRTKPPASAASRV